MIFSVANSFSCFYRQGTESQSRNHGSQTSGWLVVPWRILWIWSEQGCDFPWSRPHSESLVRGNLLLKAVRGRLGHWLSEMQGGVVGLVIFCGMGQMIPVWLRIWFDWWCDCFGGMEWYFRGLPNLIFIPIIFQPPCPPVPISETSHVCE